MESSGIYYLVWWCKGAGVALYQSYAIVLMFFVFFLMEVSECTAIQKLVSLFGFLCEPYWRHFSGMEQCGVMQQDGLTGAGEMVVEFEDLGKPKPGVVKPKDLL